MFTYAVYREKEKAEAKKKSLQHKAVQTFEDYTVSELDLTSDEPPNEEYWRRLAEKRGEALNDSLHENEKLKENIEALQEENQVCKNMLDESRHLVEILQVCLCCYFVALFIKLFSLQEMLDDSQTEED